MPSWPQLPVTYLIDEGACTTDECAHFMLFKPTMEYDSESHFLYLLCFFYYAITPVNYFPTYISSAAALLRATCCCRSGLFALWVL